MRYAVTVLLILCSTLYLKAQSFQKLIEKLEVSALSSHEDVIIDFVGKIQNFPIIEGTEVIFLVNGKGDEPELLADFNGFLNPRYIEDKTLGKMTQLSNTNWYFMKKKLADDAVLNYKYRLGNKEELDPLNSNARNNFGELVSYIQMPSAKQTHINTTLIKGEVSKKKFESKELKHTRSVFIYTPPNYQALRALPVVYFHDGSFHLNDMHAAEVLDGLIDSGKIRPLIAVFDNPVIRGKEYRGDSGYRRYFENELIPYIDSTYATNSNRGNRAVIGFSRGGLSALYLSHSTPLFSKVGVFSPAIHPTSVSDFIVEIEGFDNEPDNVFITGAIYDYIWYNDAVELADAFKNSNVSVVFKEQSTGHNIPSWQTFLDDMLVTFFSN